MFGIPHEDWGEEIKAVVAAGRGRRARRRAARRDLRLLQSSNLANFKRPKTIDFIAELPRDPNGKLYKRKLRDPYWEGKQRQI